MPYLKKPQRKPVRKVKTEDRLQIYQSTEWLKLRVAKLQMNPLCELCMKEGKVVPASLVHHIISPFTQKNIGYYAYNMNNLLSLCEQCHGTIHGTHLEESLYSIFYQKESSSTESEDVLLCTKP